MNILLFPTKTLVVTKEISQSLSKVSLPLLYEAPDFSIRWWKKINEDDNYISIDVDQDVFVDPERALKDYVASMALLVPFGILSIGTIDYLSLISESFKNNIVTYGQLLPSEFYGLAKTSSELGLMSYRPQPRIFE